MSNYFKYWNTTNSRYEIKVLAISDVDGLQSALDSKSPNGHNHTDIYYLRTTIDDMFNDLAFDSDDIDVVNATHTDFEGKNLTQSLDYLLDASNVFKEEYAAHNNNTDIHTNIEEKEFWNSKSDGNHNHNLANLAEKSYNSLTDKPSIPAAQIPTDWNQTTTTALDYIKNKPTKLSQFEKDINFDERYYTETEINTLLSGYISNNTLNPIIKSVHDLRNIYAIAKTQSNVLFNADLCGSSLEYIPSFYHKINVNGSISALYGDNSLGYNFQSYPLYIHIYDKDKGTVLKTFTHNYSTNGTAQTFFNDTFYLTDEMTADMTADMNIGVMLSQLTTLNGTQFNPSNHLTNFAVNIVIDRIAKRAYHWEINDINGTISGNELILRLPDTTNNYLFKGYYHLDAYIEFEEQHGSTKTYTYLPATLQYREYGSSTWLPLDKSARSEIANSLFVQSLQGSRIIQLVTNRQIEIRLHCPNDTGTKYMNGYVHLHYLTDYTSNEVK